ncbi:MAG TPA: hypothetical protein VFK58_08185 [Sphingomicrobium sp.]|nr:hypothetical protein [Sphingomicrobium sp.]
MSARTTELGFFPLRTILRRTLPLGLASILMLTLIVGVWDIDRWLGVPVERIVAFAAILFVLGMLAGALMEWESRRERRRWAVRVSEDLISIADEKGRTTEIPTSALQVVVAMASHTAWRGDLDIALFDDCDEPLILFPLVASGGDAFIKWLSSKSGFDATEFAAAETSARSTAHPIWVAD